MSLLPRLYLREDGRVSWDFFDRRVCLTSDDVQWCMAQEEFVRVGITEYQKFEALPIDNDEILGPHQSFSGSVRQILRDFLASDSQTLLLLEEDCVFNDVSHLDAALSELPDDWDILYLGANLQAWGWENYPPEKYSPHLFRVRSAWTTHCIGFNKKVVPFLLENQPGLSEVMFDNYLSTHLSKLNAYVTAPMLAHQRPRMSTIWTEADGVTPQFTDYLDVFERSEQMLRN